MASVCLRLLFFTFSRGKMPAMGFQMESPESLLSDFSKVLKDDLSLGETISMSAKTIPGHTTTKRSTSLTQGKRTGVDE